MSERKSFPLLEKIKAEPERYSFNVARLGTCAIDSPMKEGDFVSDDERIYARCNVADVKTVREMLGVEPTFERAGAHKKIFHDPTWTRAAVLTAGGLCPGLNTVIKGIVETLASDYGVDEVCGIRYGYAGLNPKFGHSPVVLTADAVDTIHELGGTILGSSRGSQPIDVMVDTLVRMHINVLFCIGGDGTLRGASAVADEIKKRGLNISVVGVPKTIDNDLMCVGVSFGFETAVAQSAEVIRCAHAEAKGMENGIGLVKLMGRDSGFIAAAAALANPVVNFCLIPEMQFEVDGPNGLLAAVEKRFKAGRNHAVVVVAEGAGQELIAGDTAKDASGNTLKKDIGEYLRSRLTDYFKERGIRSGVKYFDPSYTIRSCPTYGLDAIRCYMLARAAVHAAMAGRTNCVVGSVDDGYTLVPIPLATMQRLKVPLSGNLWNAVLDVTGQNRYFRGYSPRVFGANPFAP